MSDGSLTDFLLARIGEVEALARAAGSAAWRYDVEVGDEHNVSAVYADGQFPLFTIGCEDCDDGKAIGGHVVSHDPSRVLAQCSAMRRVIELHRLDGTVRLRSTDEKVYVCRTCHLEDEPPPGPMEWPCDTLRAFASLCVDHPDFRDEWRP